MRFPQWLYLTPGIYTLLVALFAGVIPVLEVFKHKWVKITYAVGLGLLCAVEIASITHDRREQDSKHDVEMETERRRFETVFSSLQGIQRGLLVQINAADALNRLAAKSLESQEKSEERQVKIRALELSQSIGQFVTQAETQISSLPTPPRGLNEANDPRWKDWYSRLDNIEHNEAADFHMRFEPSVKDAVLQLRKYGVLDKTDCDGPPERPYREIPSGLRVVYILGCAQDLQQAASKLP